MNYNGDLIFRYISGDKIDKEILEKLHNNEKFMTHVMRMTNDTKIYKKCSKRLKKTISFVKFLIQNFKEDIPFIISVSEEFLLGKAQNDIDRWEIEAILAKIFDKTYDDRLSEYKLLSNERYASFMNQVNNCCNFEEDFFDESYDLGFYFIFEMFQERPGLLEMFAKNFLKSCMNDCDLGLEFIAHEYFETVEKLENYGDKEFILDYVDSLDESLYYYIKENPKFIKLAQLKLKKVKKNWNNYIEEKTKLKISMIFDEMCDYITKNKLFEINCQIEMTKIIKELGLEEIFKKYPIFIAYELNEELIEREFLDFNEAITFEDESDIPIQKLGFTKHMREYIEKLFSEINISKIEEPTIESLPKSKNKIINYDFKEKKVISVTE